jgi:uncharacterized protein (TIGR01244 family)
VALAFEALTLDFAVAGQLAPDDLAQAAHAGFRSVINNRPDFEAGPGQPTSQAIAAAAAAAGIDYAFLPVRSGFQTPEEAAQLHALLQRLPKPVLAFCRSGTRSTNLYYAAQAIGQAR